MNGRMSRKNRLLNSYLTASRADGDLEERESNSDKDSVLTDAPESVN